jgi:hypothetical protein
MEEEEADTDTGDEDFEISADGFGATAGGWS